MMNNIVLSDGWVFMQCTCSGLVHDDLKVFLVNNIPVGKKKSKVLLGVGDPKLGATIQETLDIQCTSGKYPHLSLLSFSLSLTKLLCLSVGGVVVELTRGIRLYFHKLVGGLTAPAAAKAQLGLGHSYSRAKVKFNVHRADNMIIQSISLLDQLDKDINTFSMRIRYDYYSHFQQWI